MIGLDGFLGRAVLAGLGVALAAGPLGCFVVWRRMAFFGDATAHAAILGVAGALALEAPVLVGASIMALAMGFLVTRMTARGHGADTALGVLSHSALAAGLVAVSFLPSVRVDLTGLLLGDILSVSAGDVALVWGGGGLVVGLLTWRWNALLTATLSEDIAVAAGLSPRREELVLTLALALVVAVAIKVVGILLVGSLLIIPAAAARAFARTPERMAVMASLIGAASTLAGLAASWHLDTPAGPSIVCAAALAFALSSLWRIAPT